MSSSHLAMLCGLWLVAVCPPATAEEKQSPAEARTRTAAATPARPRWDLGDRWTVETASRRLQVRRGGEMPSMQPLQWQFSLSQFEKTLARDCYRVEVRCLANPDGHPLTVLFVDRDTLALHQVTTEIPVPGGYQTMTVSYETDSDQPGPVLGPLTALPIDVPVFLANEAKGPGTFQYRSTIGAPERKELGDLGFEHEVEQRVAPLSADEVRQLMASSFEKSLEESPFVKSLAERPVTEIRLKSAGREIRQLWQSGSPWPIYCDNGYSVCRLVSIDAPLPPAKEQP